MFLWAGCRLSRFVPCCAGRPTGRFATLAEAVESFLATRERTVRFVETCDEDLRSKPMTHPLMGIVNCHEALLSIAVHPRRHALQISEIGSGLVRLRPLT